MVLHARQEAHGWNALLECVSSCLPCCPVCLDLDVTHFGRGSQADARCELRVVYRSDKGTAEQISIDVVASAQELPWAFLGHEILADDSRCPDGPSRPDTAGNNLRFTAPPQAPRRATTKGRAAARVGCLGRWIFRRQGWPAQCGLRVPCAMSSSTPAARSPARPARTRPDKLWGRGWRQFPGTRLFISHSHQRDGMSGPRCRSGWSGSRSPGTNAALRRPNSCSAGGRAMTCGA